MSLHINQNETIQTKHLKKYDDDHIEENISFYKNKNELMKILTINNTKFKKIMNTIKS
jgi:hypothetical protein